MGERIGSLGQVRPQETQHSMADEIASQLENSKPLTTEEISRLESQDAKKDQKGIKINKFGELIDEQENK